MSLRFKSLGSGSSGNATVVEASDGGQTTRLLVDCGLGLRALTERLGEAGLAPSALSAIFVTHEHSDHIGSAIALARRFELPIWTSAGTWRALPARLQREALGLAPDQVGFVRDGQTLVLGAMALHPFAVPHDSAEPLQLVVRSGAQQLGIVTDLGHASTRSVQALQGCNWLLLEANHDEGMLHAGRYPDFLKRRVAGRLGHLSNAQAAELLAAVAHSGLQRVVAAHLSAHNNLPELALAALQQAWSGRIDCADAARGFEWVGGSANTPGPGRLFD